MARTHQNSTGLAERHCYRSSAVHLPVKLYFPSDAPLKAGLQVPELVQDPHGTGSVAYHRKHDRESQHSTLGMVSSTFRWIRCVDDFQRGHDFTHQEPQLTERADLGATA